MFAIHKKGIQRIDVTLFQVSYIIWKARQLANFPTCSTKMANTKRSLVWPILELYFALNVILAININFVLHNLGLVSMLLAHIVPVS